MILHIRFPHVKQSRVTVNVTEPILLDSDIYDADVLVRLICFGIDFNIGNPLHNLHSFGHSSKYGMLIIKPGLYWRTNGKLW